MGIAAKAGLSVDQLVQAVLARKAAEAGEPEGDLPIRKGEYEALVQGHAEIAASQEFVCVAAEGAGTVTDWFDLVMTVPRLREVRALEAFTRVDGPEPGEDESRRAPCSRRIQDGSPRWRCREKGYFCGSTRRALADWELRADVRERVDRIARNYERRFSDLGKPADRIITPRFVLLHTVAHLLINQWALECGYPAASIRERIYADDGMAGVLLYTATSDSAGAGAVWSGWPRRSGCGLRLMRCWPAPLGAAPIPFAGESDGAGVGIS